MLFNIGLIKFFSNKDYLDSLLKGYFHMTPPEKYRLDSREGIGDRVESCAASYRSSLNHELPFMLMKHPAFNYTVINGLENTTVHNKGTNDAWLNCWFQLAVPNDIAKVEELIADIDRMKAEFGRDYVFINQGNISKLLERLNASSSHPVDGDIVRYVDNQSEWGTLCKSSSYAYQREFRFFSGEGVCQPHALEEYAFQVEGGLSDIILDNPSLTVQNPDNPNEVIFCLERI